MVLDWGVGWIMRHNNKHNMGVLPASWMGAQLQRPCDAGGELQYNCVWCDVTE